MSALPNQRECQGGRLNLTATSKDEAVIGRGAEAPEASAMANLAHELANPLNAITISTELARRMLARGQAAEAAQALDSVKSDCNRCTRLMRDAQDYFSFEIGDCSEEIDLGRLLDETARGLQGRGTIAWRAPPEPSTVRGNENALTRLFRELLRNAFDHGAEGVELDMQRSAMGDLRVRIGNDGPGIDPMVLPRIFEPFFSTTHQRQSGIGLAMARRIARAHGGDVEVENQPGGVMFRVRLPIRASAVG
ncbi:MAG TPA: HAMP domain-containing sensor histidine kinase [Rhodanobacteraceae bacterium]